MLYLYEKEALIPATDRGFLFGEGVFTTIRVNNGQCEFLKEHLVRLFSQATSLKIPLPIFKEESIKELIDHHSAHQGIWRLKIILTASVLRMSIEPYIPSMKPVRLIAYPEPFYNPFGHLKTLSYLGPLMVRRYAEEHGYDDGIMTTPEGIVLEASSANLFWIHQKSCWIPERTLPYLKGIYLESILSSLLIPIKEVRMKLEEIPDEARVYYCNSLTHCRPVSAINHRLFHFSIGDTTVSSMR